MVGAVVGNYAFYVIGASLEEVTEKSVPPAIATLEFAQRTERIVAAGPALLNVTTDKEFKAASALLDQELSQAAAALAELPRQGLTAAVLNEIQIVFAQVTANLAALNSTAEGRIVPADRKTALIRSTFDAYGQFLAISPPKVA